jgi:hypothetical protein
MGGTVTAEGGKARAAALIGGIEQAVERSVAAALDRHLPHLADELAERVVDRLDRRRLIERVGREQVGQGRHRYPARDAAAWIEGTYGPPPRGGSDEAERKRNNRATMNLWRWRTGRSKWADRDHVEKVIRACGGDPADLPDELPAIDAEEVAAT